MAYDQEPDHQDQPPRGDPSAPDETPAPDDAASVNVDCSHVAGDRAGQDIVTQLAEQSALIASLSEHLNQQQRAIQNAEVSLITRIADVDDDQRLVVSRFQRSWQSHRDDVEQRLRRQGFLMVITLSLFAILLAVSMTVMYFRDDQIRRTLAGETTALRQAISNIQGQIPDTVTQDQLSSLSAAAKTISALLERFDEHVSEPLSALKPVPAQDTPAVRKPVPAYALAPALPDSEPMAAATSAQVAPEPAAKEMDAASRQAVTASTAAPLPDDAALNQSSEEAGEPLVIDSAQRRVGDTLYSLQLIGFFTLDELQQFVRTFPLPATVYYHEETHRGRPWFVLIHSLYATRDAASVAKASLPPELAKLDVWIRQLAPDMMLTDLRVSHR